MKTTLSKLNSDQIAELAALEKLPEGDIKTHDTPEQKDWRQAQHGAFYRPIKKQLTLRLDADIIEWFRQRAPNGEGYQTSINQALRDYVEKH